MKSLFALSALALALAGCATEGDTQLAQAECKVYPVTTTSVTGNKPDVDAIHQSAARADLGSSSYRFRNLARNGPAGNNIEDILRDCNR
jgi:PBP1b-binding outer membrane lipoprotein LpoB